MSLVVYTGMVDAALGLKLAVDNLWVAVGMPNPWPDENNPPAESLSVEVLTDTLCYKKVDSTSLAVPDPFGTISVGGVKYSLVSDSLAVTDLARWCYIRSTLNFLEGNNSGVVLGSTQWRQSAVFRDLVPAIGFETATALLPSQVSNIGRLIAYSNHKVRTRDGLHSDVVEFIIGDIPLVICPTTTSTSSTSTTACMDSCQISCQSACEGGACQTVCELSSQTTTSTSTTTTQCHVSCEIACQQACQISCQSCQTGCQITCQTSCETTSCQTSCQATCELSCQSLCMVTCQNACQTSGCQVFTCIGGGSCQVTCEITQCQYLSQH